MQSRKGKAWLKKESEVLVLVRRLDRWGRSVADLLATLQELEHPGVGFASLTEALDLTTRSGRPMTIFCGAGSAKSRVLGLCGFSAIQFPGMQTGCINKKWMFIK